MKMPRDLNSLRQDAFAIWQAGVDAVRGDRLIKRQVETEGDAVRIGDEWIDTSAFRRLLVVGAGKASGAMAAGLEEALAPLASRLKLTGWINVPEGQLGTTRFIHLHPARPASRNEPTPQAAAGTQHILDLVSQLGPEDWCIVLISGGGSALLPAPIAGLSLEDKRTVTRELSAHGADIVELNLVRRALSRVKGGGLRRACRAGRLDTLILSDVLGDPLETIASGPTIAAPVDLLAALKTLERFRDQGAAIPETAFTSLQRRRQQESSAKFIESSFPSDGPKLARIQVLGNLAVAIDAAGEEAERRGYAHAMQGCSAPEGDVSLVARQWALAAQQLRTGPGPDCLISGGEPTVRLVDPFERGQGGRNAQLVAETWRELREMRPAAGSGETSALADLVLLSGGTDGEDGPTDAAGGWVDAQVDLEARRQGLDLDDFIRRNDAYTLLRHSGGLWVSGPTGTNVCDLRVIVTARVSTPASASLSHSNASFPDFFGATGPDRPVELD